MSRLKSRDMFGSWHVFLVVGASTAPSERRQEDDRSLGGEGRATRTRGLGAGTSENTRLASKRPNGPHSFVSRCRRTKMRLLPGPPRTPIRTGVSKSLTNSPQFAAIFARSNAGGPVSAAGEAAIAPILASSLWAPQTRSWRHRRHTFDRFPAMIRIAVGIRSRCPIICCETS
jgi:hypothetical protein